MGFYRTELHCHSAPVSLCSELTVDRIYEMYRARGYRTVVLTNHFSRFTFSALPADTPWQEKVAYFLSDYEKLKALAEGSDMNILLGAEFRLDCHDVNDYLVYGVTEAFLLENEDILSLSLKDFSARVRAAGLLLIQAHPFRTDMRVSPPELLDGMEVYNGHPRHRSRNAIADFFAEQYDLIRTSGSDLHRDEPGAVCGGIETTDWMISTNKELVARLRSGDYALIRSGTLPN